MSQDQYTSKGSRYITEVIIERFKAAFKTGPIPLKPFNVIIGRNGSGKSTLIEALQWLDTTIRRDARMRSLFRAPRFDQPSLSN